MEGELKELSPSDAAASSPFSRLSEKEGWVQVEDPKSGRYYYYQKGKAATTTTWDTPKPFEDVGLNAAKDEGGAERVAQGV